MILVRSIPRTVVLSCTDPGQFVINVRMPSGIDGWKRATGYIARVEKIIRDTVRPKDLSMIILAIGVYPDLSAIHTTNASMDTALRPNQPERRPQPGEL